MSRNTGPTRDVVQLVVARSQMHCESASTCAGRYLDGERGLNWSLHHRAARRMGGSRNPALNRPSNLIAICGSGVTGCHGRIESSRLWAVDLGLLVPSWGDPRTTPVYLRYGNVLLDDEGSWSYAVEAVS